MDSNVEQVRRPLAECRCKAPGFPCRDKATQEDMMCDYCRQRGCATTLVHVASAEDASLKMR